LREEGRERGDSCQEQRVEGRRRRRRRRRRVNQEGCCWIT
jgi:hypothetical protein